jgi:hypothetical protein
MKTTVDKYDFRKAFLVIRPENFSLIGLDVLFEHLEQLEQDTGEEMELDVIALCCDYNEDTWQDIAVNYSIDLSDCEDEDDKIKVVREYLEENTFLAGESYNGAFVYQAF